MKCWLLLATTLLAAPALAAGRSLIADDTGQNCTVNQDAPLLAAPDSKAKVVWQAPEGTPVHVVGGKQYGEPADFPHTDSEWSRTWLHVRAAARKAGWTLAATVNCTGA